MTRKTSAALAIGIVVIAACNMNLAELAPFPCAQDRSCPAGLTCDETNACVSPSSGGGTTGSKTPAADGNDAQANGCPSVIAACSPACGPLAACIKGRCVSLCGIGNDPSSRLRETNGIADGCEDEGGSLRDLGPEPASTPGTGYSQPSAVVSDEYIFMVLSDGSVHRKSVADGTNKLLNTFIPAGATSPSPGVIDLGVVRGQLYAHVDKYDVNSNSREEGLVRIDVDSGAWSWVFKWEPYYGGARNAGQVTYWTADHVWVAVAPDSDTRVFRRHRLPEGTKDGEIQPLKTNLITADDDYLFTADGYGNVRRHSPCGETKELGRLGSSYNLATLLVDHERLYVVPRTGPPAYVARDGGKVEFVNGLTQSRTAVLVGAQVFIQGYDQSSWSIVTPALSPNEPNQVRPFENWATWYEVLGDSRGRAVVLNTNAGQRKYLIDGP